MLKKYIRMQTNKNFDYMLRVIEIKVHILYLLLQNYNYSVIIAHSIIT